MIRPFLKAGIVAASIFLGLAAQAEAATTSLTIGLSNGWVGSEWRTQMIAEAQAAAAAWQAHGVDVHVIVQSATTDVPGQIGQVRNFINQGVNAIIINPSSPTAFSPVFAEAHSRGILVVATDAEVSSKDAIYVGINQKEWAEKSAEWLAKTLHGQGNVVAINGIAGNAANEMRVAGYREVFAKYPGIKVLNEANANWDEAQGQQVMQNLLATYPNIQGVWVQDGMAAGAWRAIIAANKAELDCRDRGNPEGFSHPLGRRPSQFRRLGEPAGRDGERAQRRGVEADRQAIQGWRVWRGLWQRDLYSDPVCG